MLWLDIKTVVVTFKSVLKLSYDDEDFSVSWPASDEWRVIGVWSALSYRRWLMLGLCLCTLVLAPSIVISYSNILGCFWLDMWSDKGHQHQ